LQNLRNSGIDILTIGINLSQSSMDNFFSCVTTPDKRFTMDGFSTADFEEHFATTVPVPAAAYLFSTALLGLAGIKRKK
ncbi:hypothetical protein LCGC14_3101790, partial [marine sediment metagenome]